MFQGVKLSLEDGTMMHRDETIDTADPYQMNGYFASEWSAATLRSLTLDTNRFVEHARRLSGDDSLELRPGSWAPLSADAARVWLRVTDHVHALYVAHPDLLDNGLVSSSLFDLTAAAYLQAFPTTWQDARLPGQTRAPGMAVRRACDFIRANAAKPITVADVAVAARLSIRGLQQSFRRELATNPTAYIRAVRLAHVRTQLRPSDVRDTTVAAIAQQWGFTQLGRFANQYRAQFHESPSTTLRQPPSRRQLGLS